MENREFAIQTLRLTKNFGSRNAVNAINIEIRQGEIFSLLGRNGAGKTTTIKMLCCLLKPTSGTASVMGHNIHENPIRVKEIIGVSPQETAIAGHLNTMENLLLMGGVSGLRWREARMRAKNLMLLMELEDRKDQSRKLSGGMQRRLSIAMALMSDPQVLFLDEPTLGLDPHARKSVWDYIEKLKGSKTIMLTTHYLEEADALSDHIAVIDKAKIIETGTSHELKLKYTGIRTLRISAVGFPLEMVENLKRMGMDVNLISDGLEIQAPVIDFYPIMDILHANHVIINGIQMQEPTLDDVFLQLTGKEAGV